MIQFLFALLLLHSPDQRPADKPVSHSSHRFYAFEKRTHQPLDSVMISVLYEDSVRYKVMSSADGIADISDIPYGKYRVEYRKKNTLPDHGIYLTMTAIMNINRDKTADTMWMDKIYGCILPYRINNVYFDAGSDVVRADGIKELDKLATLQKDNPGLTLEISGHSDCLGSPTRNMHMSLLRAENVKAYLVSKGFPTSMLIVVGYGDTRSVNSCEPGHTDKCSPETLQQNRRVEFKIVKM